jgi:hypothetical protein
MTYFVKLTNLYILTRYFRVSEFDFNFLIWLFWFTLKFDLQYFTFLCIFRQHIKKKYIY